MQRMRFASALVAASAVATAAFGQWIDRSLHPPGAATSGALAIDEDAFGPWPRPVTAGFIRSADDHAGTWEFSFPHTFESVHPSGWDDSQCLDVQDGQRVGFTSVGVGFDVIRAALWQGDPATHVNLHPIGARASFASSVYEEQQVGFARFTSENRAGFWTGDAASWTSLHPDGALESEAWAAGADGQGPMQAGWVQYQEDAARAAIWRGTPESVTSVHPDGFAQSWIYAVDNDVQAGYALVTDFTDARAAIWRGTASSFVSLHPDSAQYSAALAVWGRYQVGLVKDAAGTTRAMLWRSRVDRAEDLHAVLPPRFSNSEARGVWSDGRFIYVVGIGYTPGGLEALLWSREVSCHVDLDGDGELTVFDFLAFQNLFIARDYHADFDGDGEFTLFDFLAFQSQFAAGC